MGVYPIFLGLLGRRCVVIGGGAVAARKVRGLLACGAVVTVVSPAVTPTLERLARRGQIRRVRRRYRDGDLEGATLAFAATGDVGVSAAVFAEGRRRRVWVNAADDPARCDFILPATVRRGRLTIALGTAGASPAVARAARKHLEASLGPEWGRLLVLAASVRRDLRARGTRASSAAWRRALAPDVRRLVAAGRGRDARRALVSRLGATACV